MLPLFDYCLRLPAVRQMADVDYALILISFR